MEVFAGSTANAIVLSIVLESRRTSRVPATISIPEWDEGLDSLFFQRLDDLRGAVAAVSNGLLNGQLVPISHPLDLLQVRLIVVSGSGRHLRIQDDPTVGIDRLMDFVFELPRRTLLLSQRGVGIGAAAVRLIG